MGTCGTAAIVERPADALHSMELTELCMHGDGTVSWSRRTVTFPCPFTPTELAALRAERDAAVAEHEAATAPAPSRRWGVRRRS